MFRISLTVHKKTSPLTVGDRPDPLHGGTPTPCARAPSIADGESKLAAVLRPFTAWMTT